MTSHSSPRAALIYQHATQERDEAIAAASSEIIATAPRELAAELRGLRRAHGLNGAGSAPPAVGR